MSTRADEIKKRIDDIRKDQTKLEKLLAKQEEDGIYDESIYDNIDKLEQEYDQLNEELNELEE